MNTQQQQQQNGNRRVLLMPPQNLHAANYEIYGACAYLDIEQSQAQAGGIINHKWLKLGFGNESRSKKRVMALIQNIRPHLAKTRTVMSKGSKVEITGVTLGEVKILDGSWLVLVSAHCECADNVPLDLHNEAHVKLVNGINFPEICNQSIQSAIQEMKLALATKWLTVADHDEKENKESNQSLQDQVKDYKKPS
eukprot:m.149816 g.149816  ORF g.149816 m.149816 type:complete len:195 (-) comp15019_c3_seq1:1212-1796(-)